jgi:hypothetical protein
MKTSIDRNIEAARRRVQGTNLASTLGARGALEIRAATLSSLRANPMKSADLKAEAFLAKAAAARKLLRRG